MISIDNKGKKSWVTFTFVPADDSITVVVVCGEWDNWNETPMKQKKNGEFTLRKYIESDASYQFGYKVNGSVWMIEEECMSVVSPFHSRNSVLEL
ncbi:MAG: hypothetical protein AB7S65_09985 [Sulfuricurvum sp.]